MKDGNDRYDLNLLVTKLNAIIDRAAENDRRFLGVAAPAQRASLSVESIRRLNLFGEIDRAQAGSWQDRNRRTGTR